MRAATNWRILMKRLSPHVAIVALVALTMVAIAGCGGSSATSAVQKVDATKAVGMLESRVVVDVRTAAEFAAGHIAGAQNIDVEAADFPSRISTLDKTAAYLVYCHSGRRSANAAQQMAAAGFSDIVDAGAMADIAAAGAPVE
jgi:rhodanese-related sulfurtransferase